MYNPSKRPNIIYARSKEETYEPRQHRRGKAGVTNNPPPQPLAVTFNHALDDNTEQTDIITEQAMGASSGLRAMIRGRRAGGNPILVKAQFVDATVIVRAAAAGPPSCIIHAPGRRYGNMMTDGHARGARVRGSW